MTNFVHGNLSSSPPVSSSGTERLRESLIGSTQTYGMIPRGVSKFFTFYSYMILRWIPKQKQAQGAMSDRDRKYLRSPPLGLWLPTKRTRRETSLHSKK